MIDFQVQSGQGAYPVQFLDSIPQTVSEIQDMPRAVYVLDRNVAKAYPAELAALTGKRPSYLLDANEEEKTLDGVGRLAAWMQKSDCDKKTVMVTLGGGIAQDVSALAAQLFYRGIPWIFVPTTLLAMSDSCIGAKTGVNHGGSKNQLGCFKSPVRVLICPGFTNTLSDTDVASGYGEILKLMVASGREGFERLCASVSRGGLRNPELASLISESLQVKRRVIESDEYEKDLRRTLNYGHTFGHVLESLSGYSVPHGLAVAWGMDLIDFISIRRAGLDPGVRDAIRRFIETVLPRPLLPRIRVEDLIEGAKRDKKAGGGTIALALLEDFGRLKIVETPFEGTLSKDIGDYFGSDPLWLDPKT